MHLDLTEDQDALREGTARLCRGRFSVESLRHSLEDGLDRERWADLAEAGVFSLRQPEADGGAGMRVADAVVVFEELGRALVPGPLVATHLATGTIPGLSARAVVGVVRRDFGAVVVEHLASIDHLVVLEPDGVTVVRDVPRLRDRSRQLARPLDPLTPVWTVDVLGEGERVGGIEELSRWMTLGDLLTASLAAGLASAATELTAAYVKEREQFGRVVGSFQAVKHVMADMAMRAEMARTGVEVAGAAVDQLDAQAAAVAVASAAIVASDAARQNGRDAIQLHGGMGYTWEVDAHLMMKRAQVLELQFSSMRELAGQLAATS